MKRILKIFIVVSGLLINCISLMANEYRPRVLFGTLTELLSDKSLADGSVCETNGYYNVFDGGGAIYLLSKRQPTTYSERTVNGLYAQLISNRHNIRCYGASEDRDCSEAIQKAIKYNSGGYITIPDGKFKIEKTIPVKNGSISIFGVGDGSVLYIEKGITLFDYSNNATERLTVRDVCFESNAKGHGNAIQLGNKGLCLNTLIDHCVFRDFESAIVLNKEVDNLTIRDCYFLFDVNGVCCGDISTNKSSVRIQNNHFQMQREGGVSVHLEVGSSVDVSNNLFQTAHRNNIIFMKLHSLNQVVVSNNYLELSGKPDSPNSVGIDIDYVTGMKIDHVRAQGYMRAVVRVYNTFWTEINHIVYSSLGHSLPTVIENVPGQKVKKIFIDRSLNAINATSNKQNYIDNMDGVRFLPVME